MTRPGWILCMTFAIGSGSLVAETSVVFQGRSVQFPITTVVIPAEQRHVRPMHSGYQEHLDRLGGLEREIRAARALMARASDRPGRRAQALIELSIELDRALGLAQRLQHDDVSTERFGVEERFGFDHGAMSNTIAFIAQSLRAHLSFLNTRPRSVTTASRTTDGGVQDAGTMILDKAGRSLALLERELGAYRRRLEGAREFEWRIDSNARILERKERGR